MTHIYVPTLAALLLAATTASGQVVQTLDVNQGDQFRLETDSGSVEVRSHDENTVRIDVRRNNDSADEILADIDVTISRVGNEVVVTATERRSWLERFGRQRSLQFRIDVPTGFDLDLSTGGGSVEIGSALGDVRASTGGGSVRLDRAESAVLRTGGGSVTVGEVRGPLAIDTGGGAIHVDVGSDVVARTAGGSIRIERVTESVDADSRGGSVNVGFDAPPVRDSRVSTSGGSVTVTVPVNASFNLDARGGRVTSDLPVVGDARATSRSRLEGAVNGGGPQLSLRSSGNISIRAR